MQTIILDNLSKKYGKEYGIKDLNFSIEEGEIFGFIGPNGAGKSTTIRTILNLIFPYSGTATVLDMDSQKDYAKILHEVGYLPSELFYYDNMKAIKLLEYSEKFYKKDCSIRREELANILNVDLHKKISDMSFGTKKKVGIIDALQHEPKIIILDEPTTGLDPLVQKKFFEILLQEKERGTTILFSSHVLGEVQKICDRTGIIKNGELVAIEDMRHVSDNNYKRVTIKSKDILNIELDGVSDLNIDGYITTFLYKGSVALLVSYISQLDLVDIKIEEPDLEEIFMHYYE